MLVVEVREFETFPLVEVVENVRKIEAMGLSKSTGYGSSRCLVLQEGSFTLAFGFKSLYHVIVSPLSNFLLVFVVVPRPIRGDVG